MPTLPERATSILGVLARQAPSADAMPPPGPACSFDWQALVEAKKPGSKSESQRQQALRVRQMLGDLHAWAQARGLPGEHVEEAALYEVVCTTPATSDARALAVAQVVFWIYLLDDFLDRRSVAKLAAGQGLAQIDRDLDAVLAPLTPVAQPTP